MIWLLKVAVKNYALNTLSEENIWDSLDWAQGSQWPGPETILFPYYLALQVYKRHEIYME